MSNVRYCSKFFKTRDEAIAFRRDENDGCGSLYSNVPRSRTKSDYLTEASMKGMSEEECKKYPHVIAWNETVV